MPLDVKKLKFNKGFALYGVVAILLIYFLSTYDLGELTSTLLIIGIVWVTIYALLVKKMF